MFENIGELGRHTMENSKQLEFMIHEIAMN